MPYTVSKDFEFDAGHRLAKGYVGSCAALHGHRYKVQVELECQDLDQFDMVFDFNELNIIRKWVDEHLDHHLLLYVDDALYDYLLVCGEKQVSDKIYPCDDNPTAEYIAKLVYEQSQKLLKENLPDGVEVVEVTVWETPKCKATYYKELGDG